MGQTDDDEALRMRLAMHFECVHDVIGRVAVLSDTLTTQQTKDALGRLQLTDEREWRLDLEAVIGCDHQWTSDVAMIAEKMGVEKEEVLFVTNTESESESGVQT